MRSKIWIECKKNVFKGSWDDPCRLEGHVFLKGKHYRVRTILENNWVVKDEKKQLHRVYYPGHEWFDEYFEVV